MQVVPGQQHGAEDFLGHDQMMQVGAAVLCADRAAAVRIQRLGIVLVPRVAKIELAVAGEGLAGAAGPGRQHAIEHVDAAHHTTDQIGGLAHPH